MEVGTQVWYWDDKGCDVGFPDDPEACGGGELHAYLVSKSTMDSLPSPPHLRTGKAANGEIRCH